MSQQRIEIIQEFPYPVSQLFAFLSVHENLEKIFVPAKIRTIKAGADSPNGVGSVRQLRILLAPPFEETVTAYKENELIEYRITRGSPLKNHHGVMRFYPLGEGSRLHYTIEFDGKLPLVAGVIKKGLEQGIRRGLSGLRL